jgi:uncharacterized DUF497 family protein/uncharacterized protein (DUF4415 family)
MDFEWHDGKNKSNIAKHGISFHEAKYAFFDIESVIILDKKHSSSEKRYYCIGKAKNGEIVTVRFTLRNSHIRIIGAGYWREGKSYMSKINYTDAPDDVKESFDNPVIVENLLPSPEEFIQRSKKEKITISIDKHSLDLYKAYAKKHDAKYQTMINEVLGSYADKHLMNSK